MHTCVLLWVKVVKYCKNNYNISLQLLIKVQTEYLTSKQHLIYQNNINMHACMCIPGACKFKIRLQPPSCLGSRYELRWGFSLSEHCRLPMPSCRMCTHLVPSSLLWMCHLERRVSTTTFGKCDHWWLHKNCHPGWCLNYRPVSCLFWPDICDSTLNYDRVFEFRQSNGR